MLAQRVADCLIVGSYVSFINYDKPDILRKTIAIASPIAIFSRSKGLSLHRSNVIYAKWTNNIKSPKSAEIQFQGINRVHYGAPCRKEVNTDLTQYCIAIKTTGKKFGLNENLLNFKVEK